MKSYIDLDDTLADTSAYIQKNFNYKKYAINASVFAKNITLLKDAYVWNVIKNNSSFWSSLPKSKNADNIVKSAFNLAAKDWSNVFILTALPKLVFKKGTKAWRQAEEEKINWVKTHYPQIPVKNIIVLYAKEKKLYANQESVLIDDSRKNVKAWNSKKGVSYHVNALNEINKWQ